MVNNTKLNKPSNKNQEWIEKEALGIEELFSGDYSKLSGLDKRTIDKVNKD
jgi:hypothetical protein